MNYNLLDIAKKIVQRYDFDGLVESATIGTCEWLKTLDPEELKEQVKMLEDE